MLLKTDSGCANHSACKVVDDGLMTYPMYWASSVNDWYWASGDTEGFLRLAPDMGRIIDNAVEKFLQPGLAVAFFGWDDRIANGFCGSCNLEVQLGFAALTIRACGDFAASLAHAGDPDSFTRFRPYLAHFFPVFSHFLRVFTVLTRRFQRAASRNPGPRDSGKGAQTPFQRTS